MLALAAPAIRRAPAPLALMATAGVALLVVARRRGRTTGCGWRPFLLVAAASAWRARSLTWLGVTLASAAVFVVAPHQLDLPHAGVGWTLGQQVFGGTYVWFTVLLFVVLWWRWRAAR